MPSPKRSILSIAVSAVLAASYTFSPSVVANPVDYFEPIETDQAPTVNSYVAAADIFYQVENQSAPADFINNPGDEAAALDIRIDANLTGNDTIYSGLAIISSFGGNITLNEDKEITGLYGIRYLASQTGTLNNNANVTGQTAGLYLQNYNEERAKAAQLDWLLNPEFNGFVDTVNNAGTISSINGYAALSESEFGIAINNTGSLSGKLKGNFIINNKNNGVVDLFQGSAGDSITSYTGESGSELKLNITGDTESSSAILNATGTVTIKDGAKVIIVPAQSVHEAITADGKTYLVIQASDAISVESEDSVQLENSKNAIIAANFDFSHAVSSSEVGSQLDVTIKRKASVTPPDTLPVTPPVTPPDTLPVTPPDTLPVTPPVTLPVTPPQEALRDELIQMAVNTGFSLEDAAFIVDYVETVDGANDPIIAQIKAALLLSGDSSLTVEEQIAQAVSKAAPLIDALDNDEANIALAGIESGAAAVQRIIDVRNAGNLGVNTGDELAVQGLWMEALYDKARQADSGDISGYKAKTKGFTLGFDREFEGNTTAGVAFSHAISDINSSTSHAQVESKSYIATLYATKQIGEYFVEGSYSYGQAENDGLRANQQIKSNYDSKLSNLRGIFGKDFYLNDRSLLLQLMTGINVSNTKVKSHTETGSLLAEEFQRVTRDGLELGLGLRMNTRIEIDSGVLMPNLRAMYWRDVKADDVKASTRFIAPGAADTVSQSSPHKNTNQIGVGVKYLMGNNFTLSANYDRSRKSGFSADTYTAKVRYEF